MLPQRNPNKPYQAMLDRAKHARRPFDREMWLNMAFFLSRQYVEWFNGTDSMREIPRPKEAPNIPRPVSNKIQHFVLQEQAMLLQTRPGPDVMPAGDDLTALSDAAVLAAYLKWLANPTVGDFDGVLSQAVLWALAGTESYIKWTWNPSVDTGHGKGRGDFMPVMATDLYTDPYAQDFYKSRWAIHSRFMDVEQVYDTYGIEVPASAVDTSDPNRVGIMREMGMAGVLDGAEVNELWMRPNRRYPQGMFVTWSGNQQLVPPSPFPYRHGQLPFTQIGSIQIPGVSHYGSAVSSMRSAQMELNNFHAQGILIRQAFANPKWGLPNELNMDAVPDDSPNQILRYDSLGGAIKPEIIQPAAMPPNDNGAWIAKEMMDIVGLHEVSQAQVPGRVEAAKAIELLQQADNGRLAEMLRTVKKSISVGFYQQAMLVKQFGSPDTIFMTYSKEGFPEVKHLWAQKISPGIQINVTMQSQLGETRAAREDRAMLMWQNGILTNQEQMAEMMNVSLTNVTPDNAPDIRLARNENFRMAQSKALVPNGWDNHDIHRREHNQYRKTAEFAQLPIKAKQIFEFHVKMHDRLQEIQLGQELQRQMLAGQVAAGAGFQMGMQAGAQGTPQPGQPQPDANSAQASAAAPGGAGGPVPVPNAAGASPPVNPFATRDTPQAQAQYGTRTENNLHHPRV